MQHSGPSPTAEARREGLGAGISHDYSASGMGIVPLAQRRSLYHFVALWVTLAAGFTYLFLGFQYHAAGYSLGEAAGAGAWAGCCTCATPCPHRI